MKTPSVPKLRKFPAAKQRLMDRLLDKNSSGSITAAEKSRLESLVAEAEGLAIENAKRLLQATGAEPRSPP